MGPRLAASARLPWVARHRAPLSSSGRAGRAPANRGFEHLAQILISTFPSSVNWRRRSFRSTAPSNRVRWREYASTHRSGVSRSGRRRWKTRRGTRTTPPHEGNSLLFALTATHLTRTVGDRAVPSYAAYERSDPRRTALGRAGYDYQPKTPIRRSNETPRPAADTDGRYGWGRPVRAQQKAMPVIGQLPRRGGEPRRSSTRLPDVGHGRV